jgi:glycosyltransferase involved in cell wall biosynthesis
LGSETKISVIIVTYNRPAEVAKAIDSLLNQTVEPYEIIVIDDASSVPFTLKLTDSHVKVVRFNEEHGLSNSRNYGIQLSKGDYVAFMDDDCIADSIWLEEIQKGVDKGAEILGGPLRPLFKAEPPVWWDEYELGYFVGVGNSKDSSIWGANMIFKKTFFDKIGFFNAKIGRQKGKLFACEDLYMLSEGRKRFKVMFVQTAQMQHLVKAERLSLRYILRWSYYAGKSQKIASGPNKIAGYLLLKTILEFSNPFSATKKATKIRKIALMAELIGTLF